MSTIDSLLEPLSRKQFFAEYWEKKSVYLPRSSVAAHRFKHFPGLEEFPRLLADNFASGRWNSVFVPVYANVIDQDGAIRGIGPVPKQMLPGLFNAGASLRFGPVHELNDTLKSFVDSIKKEASLPGEVGTTCYVTPPKSGSSMHFDSQNVFLCQVSGSKHWRFSATATTVLPPINLVPELPGYQVAVDTLKARGVEVRPPDADEFLEATLHPGDVLYLPPGAWHMPHTSDIPSLHYTLTFLPFNFLSLLFALTRLWSFAAADWRKDLRFWEEPDSDGKLAEFLRARLGEAQSMIRDLDERTLLTEYRSSLEMMKSYHLYPLFKIE